MGHKLECADRVGYTLKVVALAMCEVVHGVAMPLGSCAVVRGLYDTIHDGVAEVHVGICHVELCAKHHRAFYSLRRVHRFEQSKALLNGTVAVWAWRSSGSRCAFLLCDLLRGLLVYISHAFVDHPNGKIPQLLEVIGSVIDVSPFESQPTDVVKDVFYIFVVLLRGIGIVEAKVANAIVFLCCTEVHADGLCVTNVKIAVGLWRKAGLQTAPVLASCKVFLNQLLNKTHAALLFAVVFFDFHLVLFILLLFVAKLIIYLQKFIIVALKCATDCCCIV